jgi:hypothetical protein
MAALTEPPDRSWGTSRAYNKPQKSCCELLVVFCKQAQSVQEWLQLKRWELQKPCKELYRPIIEVGTFLLHVALRMCRLVYQTPVVFNKALAYIQSISDEDDLSWGATSLAVGLMDLHKDGQVDRPSSVWAILKRRSALKSLSLSLNHRRSTSDKGKRSGSSFRHDSRHRRHDSRHRRTDQKVKRGSSKTMCFASIF